MIDFDTVSGLGKWPRLVVVGADVTSTQAAEILIRTNVPYMYCNDRIFAREAWRALGFEPIPDEATGAERLLMHEAEEARREELGSLPLREVFNSRICSSWIGGPYGWVDWEGRVGCSTWNVGKWPDVEDIYHDWKIIAEAFPYLNLVVQFVSEEGEGRPVVAFTVKDGQVDAYIPTEALPVGQIGPEDFLHNLRFGSEAGISIFDLKRKVDAMMERRRG